MELFRLLHQAQRLAVALRVGGAEVPGDFLLGIFSLFDADHGHGPAVQLGNAAQDRGIVGKAAGRRAARRSRSHRASIYLRAGGASALAGGAKAFIGVHCRVPPPHGAHAAAAGRRWFPSAPAEARWRPQSPFPAGTPRAGSPPGSLARMVCSITLGPAKPISAPGSARMMSRLHGKAGGYAAGGGVGQHAPDRSFRPALWRMHRAAGLGHLHQGEDALLHACAAGDRHAHDGQAPLGGQFKECG